MRMNDNRHLASAASTAQPYAPLPTFPAADVARARTLVGLALDGRTRPGDGTAALELLKRLLPYTELLRNQRSALRIALRSAIGERDGRLCYILGDDSSVPLPTNIERAVRGALAAARPDSNERPTLPSTGP